MNYLSETLTIGVLAEAAGVNVETIRFYQRKGLSRSPIAPWRDPRVVCGK
jgi:MerR family mercuric resistance operon transcriptional regulator